MGPDRVRGLLWLCVCCGGESEPVSWPRAVMSEYWYANTDRQRILMKVRIRTTREVDRKGEGARKVPHKRKVKDLTWWIVDGRRSTEALGLTRAALLTAATVQTVLWHNKKLKCITNGSCFLFLIRFFTFLSSKVLHWQENMHYWSATGAKRG